MPSACIVACGRFCAISVPFIVILQTPARSSPLGGKPVAIELKADWLLTVGGPSVGGPKVSPRGERAALLSAATAEMLELESRSVQLQYHTPLSMLHACSMHERESSTPSCPSLSLLLALLLVLLANGRRVCAQSDESSSCVR
jgi:hypothetical protein